LVSVAAAAIGAAAVPTPAAAVLAPAAAVPALAAAAASVRTGNLLVLDRRGALRTATAAVDAVIARIGARRAGRSVPEIGLITVRPPLGLGLDAAARTLRPLPGVASVQVEHRYVPRFVPNDPALVAPEQNAGVVQWTLAREGFYRAWDISHGDGALIGVIDTGIDGGHPDLAPSIAAAVDQQDPSVARGNARTDEVGHGTHVSSQACAATNNGIGLAGAGFNCKLVMEKSDFSDSSIAASIVDATKRHVQAINMSFGPANPVAGQTGSDAERQAINYAAARGVVLVAAAADTATAEQGDPANVLQPAGTGQHISEGLGLSVTAADFTDHRASFAGYGSEISISAYGALKPGSAVLLPGLGPPPGVFGAFPGNSVDLEALPSPCGCRTTFGGDNRYAYVQGTSVATPQVTAAAAMMRVLNPYVSVAEIVRALKLTARRPGGGGWTSDLGWGILDASAALEAARRLDGLAPVSRVHTPSVTRARSFTVRWSGHDVTRPGLIPSGIDHFDVYVGVNGGRSRLIRRTAGHQLRFSGTPGSRYVFFTVAVDKAGNREVHPVRATTRVARGAR
jgi:subtilisin family serine protease